MTIVGAYSGWWVVTADALSKSFANWADRAQAKGAHMTPSRVSIGGYPFAFSVKATDLALSWPNGYGFSSQLVKVRVRPWSLNEFKIRTSGGFMIHFPLVPGQAPAGIAGETLRGSATMTNSGWPEAIDLSADTVAVARVASEEPKTPELSMGNLSISESRPSSPPLLDSDPALEATLAISDLSAPFLEGNPIGATVRLIMLQFQLRGTLPESADLAGVKAWRDVGGTLEIQKLELDWGQLDASATGTLALDADLQPEGAFTATLTGFEPTIDALANAGWIKPSIASAAKFGLGFGAWPGPDGKPVAHTPLTIQDRELSAGAFKLGRVPAIRY